MKTKTENPPVTIKHDGSKECLSLVIADDIQAVYIKMNGRIYYLDDSTGEQIMDHWID